MPIRGDVERVCDGMLFVVNDGIFLVMCVDYCKGCCSLAVRWECRGECESLRRHCCEWIAVFFYWISFSFWRSRMSVFFLFLVCELWGISEFNYLRFLWRCALCNNADQIVFIFSKNIFTRDNRCLIQFCTIKTNDSYYTAAYWNVLQSNHYVQTI